MNAQDDSLAIVKLLLNVDELRDLGDIALLHLTGDAQYMTLAKGTKIQADQYLNRRLYLLEGEIELAADNKIMQHLHADSKNNPLPLFRIHTHGLVAKASTKVKLLTLDELVYQRYVATIKPKATEGISVEEYHDAGQLADVIEEIRHVFHHNEVDLPSLPEVALRVNASVKQDNQDLRSLAMQIQADPMIAARVIQMANSAIYRTRRRFDTVQAAISRIGIKSLQVIVMSVVLRNLFKPKSVLIHKRTKAFYAHSIRVGAISHILARHLSDFDPERAFLAGLLHDIGVMPILILADQRSDLSENPTLLEQVIQKLGGIAGELLLRQWEFSTDMQIVAKEAQHWQREADTADYCDLVQIAQLHCHLVGGKKLDAPLMNELPAFKRLHMNAIDPVAVIHEARDEIHEIVSLLTH